MKKINICCGKRILPGYLNIDAYPNAEDPQPDVLLHAHKLIGLHDHDFDEIMCIHGWEHFYLWECEKVIAEWKRVLKPGGKLILELPDILKCADNLITISRTGKQFKNNDQMTMWGLFGDATLENPAMIHKWGWHPQSLIKFLKDHGFVNIREEVTQYHPAGRHHRDMRIVSHLP